MENIIITTTPSIEGHEIKEYIGLVSYRGWVFNQNYVLGNDKNKFAEEYRKFLENLENGLREEAKIKGANAVIGVKLQLIKPSMAATLLATGTAVIIE